MESEPASPPPRPTSQPGATPRAEQRPRAATPLAWMASVLLASLVLVPVAWQFQQIRAPVVLFPLLVGCALGAAAAWSGQRLGLSRVGVLAMGTLVLAAGFVAVGQHACFYWQDTFDRAARRGADAQHKLAEEFFDELTPPKNFADYLNQEARRGRKLPGGWLAKDGWAYATWAAEGALTLLGAVVVLAVAHARKPSD